MPYIQLKQCVVLKYELQGPGINQPCIKNTNRTKPRATTTNGTTTTVLALNFEEL